MITSVAVSVELVPLFRLGLLVDVLDRDGPNLTLPLSLYFAFFSVCSSEVDSLGVNSLSAMSGVFGLFLACHVELFLYRGVRSSLTVVGVISLGSATASTGALHRSSMFTTIAAPGIRTKSFIRADSDALAKLS